ncbi:putative ATP-dependent helicase YprA [Vitis vinifera]|uniref:Putative ATP-dependent helicase YprA n=1 Tax=Vitis vinifera TaxID=29760 RepID=A0A438CBM8_VITVI|nr:putative ATP-dependent helicase YprA [Vitis vinifera]
MQVGGIDTGLGFCARLMAHISGRSRSSQKLSFGVRSEIVEYGSEGGALLRNEAYVRKQKSEGMEEMAEREREIEVRSLSGESTTVSISENKTIEDLKLLLIQTFPPASNSPIFTSSSRHLSSSSLYHFIAFHFLIFKISRLFMLRLGAENNKLNYAVRFFIARIFSHSRPHCIRQGHITLIHLKEGLDHLGEFGFQVDMEDIEHLSVLCPKVVHFATNGMPSRNLGDNLIVINSSTQHKDQVEDNSRTAQKQVPISKIVSVMKKLESCFKTHLWRAVKVLMRKNGNEMAMLFSLEDLLISVKEGGAGKAKQARRSWSAVSSTNSAQSKCHDTNPLLPMEMVEHLRKGMGMSRTDCAESYTIEVFLAQMVHVEEICARMAIRVEIPDELSENTKSALEHIGVTRLYSHQAESIQASLGGKNVVVATMTSSGKSLCYNVPVLEVLSQNLLSCALYLFPTKALAQDQLRALLAMTKGSDDTFSSVGHLSKYNAEILVSSCAVDHKSGYVTHVNLAFPWTISANSINLRFVIIDEAHAYKGSIWMSHCLYTEKTSPVVSSWYFFLCMAVIHLLYFVLQLSANPRDHAMVSKRSTSSTNISKSADENVIVKRSR